MLGQRLDAIAIGIDRGRQDLDPRVPSAPGVGEPIVTDDDQVYVFSELLGRPSAAKKMNSVVDIEQPWSSCQAFKGVKGRDHFAVQQGDIGAPPGDKLGHPLGERADKPSRAPPLSFGRIGTQAWAEFGDIDALG
jgi:hypothetical protein